MSLNKNNKILIVGLGLLGGSYAEALSDKGFEVGALDVKESSIEYGISHKLISHGQVEVTKEYVSKFDVIIFCLYPKLFIEWIKEYQSFIKPNTIITDVTGVKKWVIEELDGILREDVEYIGAHPMAGKEVYGVENSSKAMFKPANYIVTPTSKSSSSAVEVARSIGELLEFKTIVELTPEVHDEMIGFLSQLTHCIAVSLMTCKESEHLVSYTGDSFRDLTRIAKINENLWSELFILNKEELINQMDLFLEQFTNLKEAINNNDLDKMKEIMRLSTKRRSYFDK